MKQLISRCTNTFIALSLVWSIEAYADLIPCDLFGVTQEINVQTHDTMDCGYTHMDTVVNNYGEMNIQGWLNMSSQAVINNYGTLNSEYELSTDPSTEGSEIVNHETGITQPTGYGFIMAASW